MNNKYDIIIVGAGPSGTSAALYASRLGLKTIIVDKSTFPRDKICGDALSGKSVKYMRELNVLDDVSNLTGSTIRRITFGSPNHKQFDINLSGPKNTGNIKEGYVIPREIFDNFLFEKAKNITEIRENFNVTDLLYENNKIIGIKGICRTNLIHTFNSLIYNITIESNIANERIATSIIINKKLVPHRGCWVGNFCALEILNSFPDSKL